MGHGKVHDQGARRRETVILSLRFLQDYIVFELDVSSFLARCRRNFMNFNSVTNGTKKRPQFKTLVNVCCFYYNRIKKGENQGKYVTFSTMMHKESGERLKMTAHHVVYCQQNKKRRRPKGKKGVTLNL